MLDKTDQELSFLLGDLDGLDDVVVDDVDGLDDVVGDDVVVDDEEDDKIMELTMEQIDALPMDKQIEYLASDPLYNASGLEEYYSGLLLDSFASPSSGVVASPSSGVVAGAAEPSPEGVVVTTPLNSLSRGMRLRSMLGNRLLSSQLETDYQEIVRKSILITGLKKGQSRISSVIFKDLGISIPDTITFENVKGIYVLKIELESNITFNHKLKDSGLIVIEIKFSGSNKVFNVHLSFWPKMYLPDTQPSKYSKTNFKIFKNGSIHLVLDNIEGAVDKTTYLKLKLDPNTKQFIIPGEDFDALTIEPNNGVMAQKFFRIILDILNHKKNDFSLN